MRLILTICFTLLNIGAFAQGALTITSSDMPTAGDILPISTASTTGAKINLGLTDSNYVWDFSNLKISSETFDTIFDTKLFSTFPKIPLTYALGFYGSNYAIRLSNGVGIGTYKINNVFDMHATSSKANTDWGFAGTFSGIVPIPFKNNPIDTVYRFPLNYLNADSSYSVHFDSLTSLIFYYHRQMRHNFADGWGKVITPYNDTFKVLRVKTTIMGFDSIVVNIGGIKFPVGIPSTTYEYKWLSNSSHLPVMQINATGATGTPVISGITLKRHIYGTGINDMVSTPQIKLYPIPAHEQVTIKSDKMIWLEVYDISGKNMWEGNVLENTSNINTAHWPSGQYVARFTFKGATQSRSFIITH